MSAPLARPSNQVLDGKYALVRELSSAGYGTVYEAEHLVVGKRVAVKIVSAALIPDQNARVRVLAEARAAAQIAHANVVDIHDLGITAEGAPYFVMELLQGPTLADMVRTAGALPVADACELTLQILAGLAAAHRKGILHCDLNPNNVVVTHPRPDGPLVKILDFAVARPLAAGAHLSGIALGAAPMYAAPEQVLGQSVDERTDVYSVAALLYWMLTGAEPYDGRAQQLPEQVARGAVRPILRANPKLPADLAKVVESGMRRLREERIPNASEFARRLRPFARKSSDFDTESARRVALRANAGPTWQSRPLPEASKPPASAVRLDRAPKLITDSILMSPRLPRPPAAPNMEPGRDFMPMIGDPARSNDLEFRAQTTLSARKGAGMSAALLAMLVGFAIGVILAWATGLI